MRSSPECLCTQARHCRQRPRPATGVLPSPPLQPGAVRLAEQARTAASVQQVRCGPLAQEEPHHAEQAAAAGGLVMWAGKLPAAYRVPGSQGRPGLPHDVVAEHPGLQSRHEALCQGITGRTDGVERSRGRWFACVAVAPVLSWKPEQRNSIHATGVYMLVFRGEDGTGVLLDGMIICLPTLF